MTRELRPSPTTEGEAAVLAVVQRAQDRLPDQDAPLADRLFALECAARGGRAVAPTVERYRETLREAEWWLEDTWEPNVPHAAVVGQALSAARALDRDAPPRWRELLIEALETLERRQGGQFGLGGDPSLLAAVLRGLDAAELTPPDWLLTQAAGVLDERRSAEATAELAEALGRHRNGRPLIANAVAAAFRADEWADTDAPYARWWLATRSREVDSHLASRVIEDARLQALTAAEPADAKAAAMVLEAAARAAGELVIATPSTLTAARSRAERRVLVSRALHRGAFFTVLLIVGLSKLHTVAHWLAAVVNATNEHPFRQTLAAIFAAGLALSVSETGSSVASAYGHSTPKAMRYIEVLGTVAAGALAAGVA